MKTKLRRDGTGFNRRTFLKASSLAAVGAVLEPSAKAERAAVESPSAPKASEAPAAKDRIDLVNVLQGTDSTHVFSRGNTLPIAALPFGMAHWTIQSQSNTPWMFQPGGRRIDGLRCTHQLSPWLADYGQAIFLPFCGELNAEPEMRSSSWRPEKAELHPHSFRLTLMRYQAVVELVPTERCAVVSATFSGDQPPGFLIEVPGSGDQIESDEGVRTIRFKSTVNEGGVPENFATYYVVRFAGAWDRVEMPLSPKSRIAIVRFAAGRAVEARIATSFISFEQAQDNLDRELGARSIDTLRDTARAHWQEHFGRIEVEGGDERQQRIFYSCLYRALLFPRMWHEIDANGNPHHFSPYTGELAPGVMYADHGYWDVYRAWYPLMSIVFPERLAEILQAWVNAYKEGGWLPQFPAPGYRACMTGSLIDAVFGDAAVKGIGGFDLAAAYEGLKKHATQPGDPDNGYGRRGIEDYLRLGFVADDHVKQSVAETVDAAYGDFCIAQVANALGRKEDAAKFLARSRNWRNLFDAQAGFLRGKLADGTWLEPFDEFAWGSPYVEGSAWQHRWDVPQDIPGLIAAMGGNEKAVAALDKMLALPAIFHVGIYGQEIHEMSEMAAVEFGQYAQSNQPVHHLLYIFALAGRPDRTQYWVRRVMAELYTPDTFPGDEDTGSMAAWFLLSAMGFYSLCPGKAEYVAGSPLFDRITLHLPEGKTTVIEAHGQRPSAVYVAKLLVDGAPHSSMVIPHETIARGSRLTFMMQHSPVV
ncbi:MAG TPA: GH92 family glycosyl hydrolase [Terracidiphilus sp.]|nr:GH92 family glycosyl hydrolase [Terracidiphilus sp.]